MRTIGFLVLVLVLAGCASGPSSGSSECSREPGSYRCQLEQYMRA
jgi:hypothetical protein